MHSTADSGLCLAIVKASEWVGRPLKHRKVLLALLILKTRFFSFSWVAKPLYSKGIIGIIPSINSWCELVFGILLLDAVAHRNVRFGN